MKKLWLLAICIFLYSASSSCGTLVEDAESSSDWIAKALNASGYKADYTLESLKEIDRFFDEHSQDGQAVPDGLLSEQLGSRMFALGSYVGEVIRRECGGKWSGDDDPQGEVNIQVELDSGTKIWPVQKVMKRLMNGSEDSVYGYGLVIKMRNS